MLIWLSGHQFNLVVFFVSKVKVINPQDHLKVKVIPRSIVSIWLSVGECETERHPSLTMVFICICHTCDNDLTKTSCETQKLVHYSVNNLLFSAITNNIDFSSGIFFKLAHKADRQVSLMTRVFICWEKIWSTRLKKMNLWLGWCLSKLKRLEWGGQSSLPFH